MQACSRVEKTVWRLPVDDEFSNLDGSGGRFTSGFEGSMHRVISSIPTSLIVLIFLSTTCNDAIAQQFDGALRGHEGAVLMGMFTPDGLRAITVSSDQTARLWDLAAGKQLRVYSQHTGPLYAAAISVSGSTLVTGSQDNTVRVWDLPPMRAEETLAPHPQLVRSLTLHPDGNRLLVGTADKSLLIHTLRPALSSGGPASAPLPPEIRTGHTAEVTATGIRSDGVMFASGDGSGRIILWNPFLPAAQKSLLGSETRISAIRFPPNNQQLVTSSDDGVIRVWSLMTPPPRQSAALTAEAVELELLAGQPIAVTALADKTIRIINLNDDTAGVSIPPLPLAPRSLAVSPNNAWFVCGGDQGQAVIVNLADGTMRGLVSGHVGEVTDIAIHADAMRLATAGADGTVRLWQLPQPEIPVAGHSGPTRGVVTAPEGQWVATISDDKVTRIIDANGTSLRQLANHEQPLRSIAVRDDGAVLATGDAGGDVWLWNPADGSAQGFVAAHPGGVIAIAFSADRSQLITTGADQKIKAWKLPLPPKKPAEGEAVATLAWEFAIPGGRLPTALHALPGEQGYVSSLAGVSETVRLKVDGTALPSLPAAARPLKAFAVTRDGQQLLGVDDQGQATLWKSTGEQLSTYALGANIVSAVFRPDGAELLICDGQARVRICDSRSGRVLEELITSAPVTQASWCGSGFRQIAAIGEANHMLILKRSLERSFVEAADPVTSLKPVTALAMSDQQHLLAARQGGAIEQWRLTDGALIRKLDTGGIEQRELAVSPNAQFVAGVGGDQKLRIWNWGDGQLSRTIDLISEARRVSISADNTRAATSHADGQLRIWDLSNGLLLETLQGHAAAVSGVRFLPDGRTLVSASADKTVRVAQQTALAAFPVSKSSIPAIALSNGGTNAIAARAPDEVVMIDMNSGNVSRTFRFKPPQLAIPVTIPATAAAIPYQPTAVASRNDNQRVAAGTQAGEVYVWNANNGDDLLARLTLSSPIVGLGFSPDLQKLAIGTGDGRVQVFGPSIPGVQPPSELILWQEIRIASPVTDLIFANDSRSVWIAQQSGTIERWAIAAPGPVRQYNHGGPVYGVAVNANGKTAVSCSADQTVRVWDNTTGQQKFQMNGHEGPVHAVAMSLDETFAMTSGADGALRLWDLTGGRQLKELVRYEATMYAVAIHPQGQLVAAAGADRKVHLLDMTTGTEVRTLTGHTDFIHSVQFSPDGSQLASYGYAGYLKLWRTADGVLLHESRQGKVGNSVAFSPDGTKLLLSGGEGVSRVIPRP